LVAASAPDAAVDPSGDDGSTDVSSCLDARRLVAGDDPMALVQKSRESTVWSSDAAAAAFVTEVTATDDGGRAESGARG
jgi:hypothetical protein